MQDLKDLIRDQVAKHRPCSDYGSWTNEVLVANFVVWRSLGRQCIIRMIAKPQDDWKATFKRASRMAGIGVVRIDDLARFAKGDDGRLDRRPFVIQSR